MKPQFAREAKILRVLSHRERLAILESLRHRPACVCHLTAALDRPQAYVSQQLGILRDAGLIESERHGPFVYYKLRDYGVLGIVDLAGRLLGRALRSASSAGERIEGCECPHCGKDGVPRKGAAG